MNQPSLFEKLELPTLEGIRLRDEGLQMAVDHAERIDPGWKEKVWNLFLRWIAKKPAGFKFLLEDFRTDVEKYSKLDSPPSKRAYGFIPAKAARLNLIEQIGTQKVKNPDAHTANAAYWEKL